MSDETKLTLKKETLRPLAGSPEEHVLGGTQLTGLPVGPPVLGFPMTRPTTCSSWGTDTMVVDPDEFLR